MGNAPSLLRLFYGENQSDVSRLWSTCDSAYFITSLIISGLATAEDFFSNLNVKLLFSVHCTT